MKLYAGIDAGQSSTTAAVAGPTGAILGRGYAGPGDEIGQDADSTRLRDALEGALAGALRDAQLPAGAHFEAIVAGISGYEGRVWGAAPRLPGERVMLMHDAPVAHAAAFGGEYGVVVIAGTGSAAYAVAPGGRTRFEGGWGYLFGDEGSAFWIVRSAIAGATAHADCAGIERLLSFFDVHSLRELVRAFYLEEISRASLASFAPVCIEAAKNGGFCACLSDPAHAAAHELARLALRAAIEPAGSLRVAFAGGLMADAWLRERVYDEVRAIDGGAEIVEPRDEPVAGALLLARAS